MGQTFSEMFPGKPKWTAANMPDLTGKIAIVTGGNTGIGKATCIHLVEHNAKVYLAARSEAKAVEAIADIKKSVPSANIHFLALDLGSVKATRAAVTEYLSKEQSLDILFNNAGVMTPPAGSKTSDGFEMQWGTNVLGHFVFAEGLVPTLVTTAKKNGDVRIVFTSSLSHSFGPKEGVVFDCLRDWKLSQDAAYGQSKLGAILLSNAFAKRYPELISMSVNPGNIRSDLQRYMPGTVKWFVSNFILYPIQFGPLTQLWAGTSGDIKQSDSGRYGIPWARFGNFAHAKASDVKLQDAVWEWCKAESAKY